MLSLRSSTVWLAALLPALLGHGQCMPSHPPPGYGKGPVSSLPASASYVYTTPALYLRLTVKLVENLGNLSTGGTQLVGDILSGHLYSEPGFEPQFNGSIKYAADYLTEDPLDGIARPACVMTVVPENNDSPFLLRIGGIDTASAKAAGIFSSNNSLGVSVPYGYSYSVWVPTFYGGYANLQNSIFVASETVAGGNIAGQFEVGMKISKIWPVNTTINIGEEFP